MEDIRLIELELAEINKSAHRIDDVRKELMWNAGKAKNEDDREYFERHATRPAIFVDRTKKALASIVEELAIYEQDSCILDGDDIDTGTGALEKILNIKEE